MLARFRSGGPPEVRDQLNRILRGWSTYFNHASRKMAYRAIGNDIY
jgi:RNA-directed DNA polymerase